MGRPRGVLVTGEVGDLEFQPMKPWGLLAHAGEQGTEPLGWMKGAARKSNAPKTFQAGTRELGIPWKFPLGTELSSL